MNDNYAVRKIVDHIDDLQSSPDLNLKQILKSFKEVKVHLDDAIECIEDQLAAEEIPQELLIELGRLEDQLVGDLTLTEDTTREHLHKRIEYIHQVVVSILRKWNKC